ncbi:uncharacterized protein LOC117270325 isoform X3 [Epinephelus lanceolatus]|uniref:uncharacterized protein LOC117270325 isoform X2 n=1 Tax=Epinephelus lanceolatus TaxID=310571 RepID=UPI001447B3F2|nr:uncharacterized protein LOC117270325 isoform X2 [Epinephelus lanceolatus]
MSLLLKEIMNLSKRAADVFRRAELNTDKDLRSLTRQDLQDLFPGAEQFKLRRAIFDIIHKQKPVEKLLRDVKKFIPDQSLRDALTNNGVLVDYLQILKDMKSQMNNVQSFLDAHIDLLEEYSTKQPDQISARHDPPKLYSGQPAGLRQVARDVSDSSDQMMPSPGSHSQGGRGSSASATSRPVDSLNDQTSVYPQGENGSSSGAGYLDHCGPMSVTHAQQPQSEPFIVLSPQDFAETRLVYQMVVAGKTFDAHVQLMDKVKEQVQIPIQSAKSDEDYQVTFVFCPISSRVASDVEAAMADVKGDKPVILVLMHHTREVKYTTPMRTWREDIEVILHVNVFYHETMHGLLKCEQNNAAASQIRDKLLECCLGSGNAQAVGAESELTGSTSGRDGGNNRHSVSDRSSSSRNWLSSNWPFGN